jgi:hypothetical protein
VILGSLGYILVEISWQLRNSQFRNCKSSTCSGGYGGVMEHGDPIAAIGSPPLRYDQRGNMRGITLWDL